MYPKYYKHFAYALTHEIEPKKVPLKSELTMFSLLIRFFCVDQTQKARYFSKIVEFFSTALTT